MHDIARWPATLTPVGDHDGLGAHALAFASLLVDASSPRLGSSSSSSAHMLLTRLLSIP